MIYQLLEAAFICYHICKKYFYFNQITLKSVQVHNVFYQSLSVCFCKFLKNALFQFSFFFQKMYRFIVVSKFGQYWDL